MPYRVIRLFALVVVLGLTAQPGPAGAVFTKFGETREYVRDWLAACRNDGTGYCSVLAYVPDPQGPGGIAAQLRVARPRPGADLDIVFTAVNRFADIDRPMTVRVDANQEFVLPPGTGFARTDALNDYGIVDQGVVDALVPQMKDGRSIAVTYVAEDGEDVRYNFSLIGLTGALRFIDGIQAKAADAAPSADPEAPRHDPAAAFSCRGNEPFWTLAIDGTGAVYARLTDAMPPRTNPLQGTMQARDYFKPPLFVWRGRGEKASGDMVAMITGERCRDTMSDSEGQSEFDYTVRVSMPSGELLTGCCNAGESAAAAPAPLPADLENVPEADLDGKAPGDWSRLVVELLPAINACVEKTPGSVPRVTKAWPMNQGMVGVRTRTDDDDHWNCVAPADGGAVEIIARVPEESVPGETRVVFTPAPHTPPAGNCFRHERVSAPEASSLIGWLSYDTC